MDFTLSDIVKLEDIPYRSIDDQQLYLDIVQPKLLPEAPMPVVLYLFGSGWAENRRKDSEQNPATFLASWTGMSVVSIDYRLSDQAIFPAQIADARAAVRWLRTHSGEYHLDPQRIGVWGYSAGGNLAALLGVTSDSADLDDTLDEQEVSCQVQAVVTVSAPIDFLLLGGWHNDPDSAEARLVGGQIHGRLELIRRTNPITYVHTNMPPFLLLHGDQDDIVSMQQSQLFYEALINVGADATFQILAGAGHNVGRWTPYWDSINEAAGVFFMRCLQQK
jgi:acetyl esterase/lipase